MGKRGPPRTPTRILKLHGSRRAEGRKGECPPEPETGIPDKPDVLSERAEDIWGQVTALTDRMGVLTVADGNALARYCEMLVRWNDLAKFLAKHGETYTIFAYYRGMPVLDNKRRKIILQIKRFPQTVIADSLATQLLRIEQQFGLTPSARVGLCVKPKDDDAADGKKRFFGGA